MYLLRRGAEYSQVPRDLEAPPDDAGSVLRGSSNVPARRTLRILQLPKNIRGYGRLTQMIARRQLRHLQYVRVNLLEPEFRFTVMIDEIVFATVVGFVYLNI